MSEMHDAGHPHPRPPGPPKQPSELVQLVSSQEKPREEQQSREVNLRLEAGYATHKLARNVKEGQVLAWDAVSLRSYNGRLGAPVIDARPGDTLNILLHNKLPKETHPATDPNLPHGYNITNLHFHGLHVSPSGNSDNVMIAVAPGEKFQYEVKIPANHPAGTHWYHPHRHGSVAIQLGSGMAGVLIIRGDIDRVPAIQQAQEKLFLFQQIPYVLNAQGIGELETYDNFGPGKWAALNRRITINGMVEPTVQMNPGELQRWRFIHGGLREPLMVKLVKRDPVTGTEVAVPQYQIALDGITTGRIEEVQETELHPGYRADVLVRAADKNGNALPAGTYWLVNSAVPPERKDRVLARIVVKGKVFKMQLPNARELAPLAPYKTIGDSEITGTQKAEFHIDVTKTPPLFLVNGKPFDPHAPPRKLVLGDVEEWTVSSSAITGHPFHIHVNPFQYTREDGTIVWKDTLFLPAGKALKLRTRYERYIGQFMLHCHIVEHEDRGMMETLEIVPPTMAHVHGLPH
jgi:FtsP/CotA-like multicopper oxidase with cupredoxin domain